MHGPFSYGFSLVRKRSTGELKLARARKGLKRGVVFY